MFAPTLINSLCKKIKFPWVFILGLGLQVLQPQPAHSAMAENVYLLHNVLVTLTAAQPGQKSSHSSPMADIGLLADLPDTLGARYFGANGRYYFPMVPLAAGVFYGHFDETVRQEHYYIHLAPRAGRFQFGAGPILNCDSFRVDFTRNSFYRWGAFGALSVLLVKQAQDAPWPGVNLFTDGTYLQSAEQALGQIPSIFIFRAGVGLQWSAHQLQVGVNFKDFSAMQSADYFGRYSFRFDKRLTVSLDFNQYLGYVGGAFTYQMPIVSVGYARRELTTSGRNILQLSAQVSRTTHTKQQDLRLDDGPQNKGDAEPKKRKSKVLSAKERPAPAQRKSPYSFISFSLLLRWGLPPRKALTLSQLRHDPQAFEAYLADLDDQEFSAISVHLERAYGRRGRK